MWHRSASARASTQPQLPATLPLPLTHPVSIHGCQHLQGVGSDVPHVHRWRQHGCKAELAAQLCVGRQRCKGLSGALGVADERQAAAVACRGDSQEQQARSLGRVRMLTDLAWQAASSQSYPCSLSARSALPPPTQVGKQTNKCCRTAQSQSKHSQLEAART